MTSINTYTIPGQQLGDYNQVLSGITQMSNPNIVQNIPQGTLSNLYNTTASNALAMNAAYPDYAQSSMQNLTQEAGIPALEANQSRFGKVFDLYLNDPNFSSRFAQSGGIPYNSMSPYQNSSLLGAAASDQAIMNSQIMNDMALAGATTAKGTTNEGQPLPTSNQTLAPSNIPGINVPDPYTATTADVIKSALGTPQDPGLTTAETAQPLSAASSLNYLLSSLMGKEQNLVGRQSGLNAENYSARMNTLSQLASLFGNALQTQMDRQYAVQQSGTSQEKQTATDTSNLWNSLVDSAGKQGWGKYDLFKYINDNQQAWKDAGINTDKIWQYYHDASNNMSENDTYLSSKGTTVAQTAKQQDIVNSKVDALRGFSNLMQDYYNHSNYLPAVGSFLHPASGYNTTLDLYASELQSALKISKNLTYFNELKAGLPNAIFNVNPDAQFKSHLQGLLDRTNMLFIKDKKSGSPYISVHGVIPKGYEKANVSDYSVKVLQALLQKF